MKDRIFTDRFDYFIDYGIECLTLFMGLTPYPVNFRHIEVSDFPVKSHRSPSMPS